MKPNSSPSRTQIRRAVCRSLAGALRSARSITSICGFAGSSFGAARAGVFRDGGTADRTATRTVRRCTRCRCASARTDRPSRSRSQPIAANSSTRDLATTRTVHQDPRDQHRNPGPVDIPDTESAPACQQVGPKQAVTRSSTRPRVGPNQVDRATVLPPRAQVNRCPGEAAA